TVEEMPEKDPSETDEIRKAEKRNLLVEHSNDDAGPSTKKSKPESEKKNENCNEDQASLHKSEERNTPQCVICGTHPRSALSYAMHIRRVHKVGLAAIEMYVVCACGNEVRNHHPNPKHTKECDDHQFTIHKLPEKTTPQCIFCEV
ncbi:hypothetical protein PENTCL1PPCAC_12304, partial [Pristionchus entomophagus]